MIDKEMEKYLGAVRRRLNMPRELKDRVMNDFICSVEARQEDGLDNSQIMAELGSAKKAAADLNEQMKEYTYKKSPWRWLCLVIVVLAALTVIHGGIQGLLAAALTGANAAASVGIIGGADGPTAIFVTTSPDALRYTYGMSALVIVMGIIGFIALSRLKRK